MLYSIVLVSAIHQHESAIGTHVSISSRISLPPSTHPILLGSHRELDLHSLYHIANSHQLSILHMVIYMFPFYSLFNPPSPFCHVHKSVLYVCVSIAALQIGSSIPYIFYIYKLIYNICLSLSDLLYSV